MINAHDASAGFAVTLFNCKIKGSHCTPGEASISGEELAQKPKGAAGLSGHTDDRQEVITSPATSLQRQMSGNLGMQG